MRKEFLLCFTFLLAVFTKAQTPNTISFQANLTTPGTTIPIADGTYSMDFALFDADIAGVSLWSETQPAVTVSEGLINVQLGSVIPLEISDFYQPVYLEITIQSETLSPRIALLAVPYAQTAKAVVGTDSILFRMLDQKAGIVDQTNTALGYYSFTKEQGSGFFNEAFGTGALENNNGGSQNTAIGSYALGSNTTGGTNIAIGYEALQSNTDGNENTALGVYALNNSTGLGNTAVGGNALRPLATGNYNVAIGYNTGSNAVGVEHVNGTYNTLIGTDASVGVDGLTNASAIGFGAVVSQNNSMVLGNADVNVGIGTSTPIEKLDVNGTVRAGAFDYSSPVEEYYFVPALDFKIAVESPALSIYFTGYDRRYFTGGSPGNAAYIVAPINLPHGSIISQIDFYVYDADATYDITEIRIYSNGNTGGYPVSGLFNGTSPGVSTGSSGNQTITSSGLSITVNNTNQGYWLYAYLRQPTSGSQLGIYGARITYTKTSP